MPGTMLSSDVLLESTRTRPPPQDKDITFLVLGRLILSLRRSKVESGSQLSSWGLLSAAQAISLNSHTLRCH